MASTASVKTVVAKVCPLGEAEATGGNQFPIGAGTQDAILHGDHQAVTDDLEASKPQSPPLLVAPPADG